MSKSKDFLFSLLLTVIIFIIIFYSSLIYKTLSANSSNVEMIDNANIIVESYKELNNDDILLFNIELSDISFVETNTNSEIGEIDADYAEEMPFEIYNNAIRTTINPYISLLDCGFYSVDWLNHLGEVLDSAVEDEKLLDDWAEANLIYNTISYLISAETGVGNETVIDMITKIVNNEIGGLTDSMAYQNSAAMEKAAVVWCIYNRVDNYTMDLYTLDFSDLEGLIKHISKFCKNPGQYAYRYNTIPLDGLKEITIDVTIRWVLEHWGYESGRVLPLEYCYFGGDGMHNNFRDSYKGGNRWAWSFSSPYIID